MGLLDIRSYGDFFRMTDADLSRLDATYGGTSVSPGPTGTTTSDCTLRKMMDAVGDLTKTIYVPRARRVRWDFTCLLRDPEKEEPAFIKCEYLTGEQCYIMCGVGVIASPAAWEFLRSNGWQVKWSFEEVNIQKALYDMEKKQCTTQPFRVP